VIYSQSSRSGGQVLDAVPAWAGDGVFRQQQVGKPVVVFAERVYFIEVASLPFLPALGDRITEAGVGMFEISPAVAGEGPFRFSDLQGRTTYRIFCKRAA
jgi:hypothetical protein